MEETIKKINELLKKFNSTFQISANIIEDSSGEKVANGLKIDKVKNNGSEFMDEMFDMFAAIIKNISDEHELVYDEEKGLAIAKKQVIINYVFEDELNEPTNSDNISNKEVIESNLLESPIKEENK